MNHPRFIVFVDPRPLECMDRFYKPPQEQCDFIKHLLDHDFQPQINSTHQLSVKEIREMCGLVYLAESKSLLRTDQYEGGKVLCLQWYNERISTYDLETVRQFCMPFYGLGKHKSYFSRREQELLDEGCLLPTEVRTPIVASAFLGNNILLEHGQAQIQE